MWGINIYTGGHYDHYIVDYFGFQAQPAPPATFDVPEFCPKTPEPGQQMTPHHKQAGVHAQLRRLLPQRLLRCLPKLSMCTWCSACVGR